MTIYEQIKKVMEGKNGMEFTSEEIKSAVTSKFGANPTSVIPSDFCYNRTNNGINPREDNRLFEYLETGLYKYLGENYPYTGKIFHKPQGGEEKVVGEWNNGTVKWK